MGKYTKKRNCRKNKSMKKGGNDYQNGSKDEVRPVEKPESSSDSTSEAQPVAPSETTSGEPKKSMWSSFASMFSSSKPAPTTGGRKNKQRKSKSKSKK